MGDMIQTIPDYAVEQARRTLRNTASVLKPRRLWSFDITGVVEVEADDEELGIDAMRRERLSRVDYQCTDSREVAYQDFDCGHCGEELLVTRHVVVAYSTRKP